MRIAWWSLLALALSSPTAFAQQAWADKMFKGGTAHDFGNVPRGTQLFHRFKMTNIYDETLEIMHVRTSCGCVTPTATVKALKRYETGFIEVNMDAYKFTGPRTVTIQVDVGPRYISTATLRVSANSRADIVFNPGEVNFGVVPRGQSAVKVIDVEYAGVLNWKVLEVVNNAAALEAGFEELYRRPGQVGYRVKVTLKPEAPAGGFKQELFLKTNDPASEMVPILVEAVLQAPLSVVPATVSLGSVRAGEVVEKNVVIRGARPFRIVALDGLGDEVSTALPPQAAPVHIITLRFQLKSPGEQRRQLAVKTDLEGEAAASIAVEGSVVP
jgi:hypothetical protein